MSTMPHKPGEGPPEVGGGIFGGLFSSPYMPAVALAFSSGLKAAGIVGQGKAMVEAAGRRQQAANFEADQMVVNAGQAVAAKQRDAYFQGLKGEQLIATIRARAGAGATDPTVLNIIGQAMAATAYAKQKEAYEGDDKARLMKMQATSRRYDAELGMQDAKAGQRTNMLNVAGVVAEGISLQQKYWPKNKTPAVETPKEDPFYTNWDRP